MKLNHSFIILLILRTYTNGSQNDLNPISSIINNNTPQWLAVESEKPGENESYETAASLTNKTVVPLARFQGLFLEKQVISSEHNLFLKLIFSEDMEDQSPIFTEKSPLMNLWTVDFYNTHLGGTIIEKIETYPIANCVFEEYVVNLNEGVNGLLADNRSVVRLKIATDVPVELKIVRDSFQKVVLHLHWKEEQVVSGNNLDSTWYTRLAFWK